MSVDTQYSRGKRTVRFLEAVGRQAEINPALPQILVPTIGTIAEVSAELAWTLVEKGRVEIVPDAPEPLSEDEVQALGSLSEDEVQALGSLSEDEVQALRSPVKPEGDDPAKGDSVRGSGGPMSWFGKRNATVAEDAAQGESPAEPEEGAGVESDAASEGDAADEAPNDPLS